MIEVRQTGVFEAWLDGLLDLQARKRIAQRILRVKNGLLGDIKPVGSAVSELRIDDGPGYRIYFVRRGTAIILLLCGGTKKTQRRDIERAIAMAQQIED